MEAVNNSDVVELQKKFDAISTKEQKSAIRSTLTSSAAILRKEAISNLNARPTKAKRGRPRKERPNPDIKRGIKARTVMRTVNRKTVIHIMGDYRLKWIELGTKSRWNTYYDRKRNHGRDKSKLIDGKYNKRLLKKKRFTGSVKGVGFFARAINTSKEKVFSNLKSGLKYNIEKKFNERW